MNTDRLLVLFFLFFFSCNLFSQNLPVNERTGKVSYRNVVQVDGFSASDLYKKAKEWFSVNTGESLNDKLISPNQYISSDNTITAQGMFEVTSGVGLDVGVFYYNITFQAKDGRYLCVITDIVHDGKTRGWKAGGAIENEKPDCGKIHMLKKKWVKLKQQANDNIVSLSKDFERHMLNSNKETNNEDEW
tara:strand:- start:284 stop:850 length:567 start_codon:yes stop_codon:yes gene_type:complete